MRITMTGNGRFEPEAGVRATDFYVGYATNIARPLATV
jgi:hypothetical protein